MDELGRRWAALEEAAVAAGVEPFAPLQPEVLAHLDERFDLSTAFRGTLGRAFPPDHFNLLGTVGEPRLELRGSELTTLVGDDPHWSRQWFPLDHAGGHLVVAVDLGDDQGRLLMIHREECGDDGSWARSPLSDFGGPATLHELLDLAIGIWKLEGDLDAVEISLPDPGTPQPLRAMSEASVSRLRSVLEAHFDWMEIWTVEGVRAQWLDERRVGRRWTWLGGIGVLLIAVFVISLGATKEGPALVLLILWAALAAPFVLMGMHGLVVLRRAERALRRLSVAPPRSPAEPLRSHAGHDREKS